MIIDHVDYGIRSGRIHMLDLGGEVLALKGGSSPLGIVGRGNALAFNVTLVGATDDAKVTVLTPVWVPGVGNFPVLDAIVDTPTDEADSMATDLTAGDVVVDTRNVVLEISIDGKSSGDGSTGHDGLLDGIRGGVGIDSAVERILVVGEDIVGSLGIFITFPGAARRACGRTSRLAFSGVRIVTLRTMMMAMRKRKGRAQVSDGSSIVVLSTSDDALFDVAPGGLGKPTTTSVHGGAEADIFSGEGNLIGTTSSDAVAVTSGRRGAESPAAATVALVADVSDDFSAFGPVGGRVEIVRNGHVWVGINHINIPTLNCILKSLKVAIWIGPKKVSHASITKASDTGFPKGVLGVDLLDTVHMRVQGISRRQKKKQ